MAIPKRNNNGVWSITITFHYKRKKLTLGAINKTEAMNFASNINFLVNHKSIYGTIPTSLLSWVANLSDRHRQQLGDLGVVTKYDSSLTVEDLITDFLREYEAKPEAEAKQSTKDNIRQVLTNRFPKFLKQAKVWDLEPKRPEDMPHAEASFSPEANSTYLRVNSWQREHYALASWSRANGRLREVGNWAVKRGICKFNPFSPLPSPDQVNDERNEYVSRDWVLDVMANCLDPDTRLLIALGRFQGLRTPSECRRMKPEHVDFDNETLVIVGKGNTRPKRRMPLFDIARQEFKRHREAVGGWGRLVFSDQFLSVSDANNFSKVAAAVERAGLESWKRLRQNLRASCENDLLEAGFSEREVVTWIGHSIRTSRKSYQKQTTTHLREAIKKARNFGIS